MKPEVSVLMSVYNGERYVRESVESILNQTFRDFEFIIVNDGSTDGTGAILAGFKDSRIVIVDNVENRGLARSLNTAISSVRGKYLARQDADDLSLPERLEKQVCYLDKHESVGLLGTGAVCIGANGETLKVQHYVRESDPAIRWEMLFANAFVHSSVMFRLASVSDCPKVYDPGYAVSQDYDLWCRMLDRVQGANIGEPLVRIRKHPGQVSGTRSGEQRRIADRISLEQMRKFCGSELRADIAAKLREWHVRPPRIIGKTDITAAVCMAMMLKALVRTMPSGSHRDVSGIVRFWTNCLRNAIRSGNNSWLAKKMIILRLAPLLFFLRLHPRRPGLL